MQGVTRARATFLPFLALGFMSVLFHFTIVETRRIPLALAPSLPILFKLGFVTASAFTHWAIYLGLLLTFALTLRPGREPLVTAMARRMHGAMSDELAFYTRRVTIAWSCFFALQLATSMTLFCMAPLVVWSFFVNIMDIPLVVAMFAAEYAVRLRFLSDPPRHSLKAIMDMVTELSQPRQKKASFPPLAKT